MRILIVTPNWIGDAVAAQPMIARLAERFPGARIDALAPRWVGPAMAAMAEIHEVIENPFGHGTLALWARWRFARQLAGRYDAAWILPNSLKSALIPWFAGIPMRVGYTGEARHLLLSTRHILNTTTNPLQAERYAQLAELPGAARPGPLPHPRLQVRPADLITTLRQHNLDQASQPVVFCPGAEYGPAKRWPAAHFASVARQLGTSGQAVWIMGSHKDRAVGDEIVAACAPDTPILNLCGITGLAEAIQLIAFARLVITNDSGLMHVAAAVGVPLIALFGSSSPGYTPPLSEQARVLTLNLECSPCFKRQCPLGHTDCLNRLTPDQVMSSAQDLLQQRRSNALQHAMTSLLQPVR